MKTFFIPRSRYSRKIFRSYSLIILFMGILITLFQYNRERKFKVRLFEQKLKIYNAQLYLYISDNSLYKGSKKKIIEQLKNITNINEYLPNPKLRTTVIDNSGEVYYDSYTSDLSNFNNHKNRPEILIANKNGIGSGIRMSKSFNFKFYYLVKKYDDFYIRTALPYNNKFITFLKADYIFIYFILGLFIPVFLILIRVTDHFGKSISKLKTFAINAANNNEIDSEFDFGKDELGEISHQIINIYQNLRLVKNDIDNQKNKLINHLFISREGIAFFDQKLNLELSNSHFYTFTSLLIQTPIKKFDDIKTIEELNELSEFIEEELIKDNIGTDDNEIYTKTIQINHSNRVLLFKAVVFRDRSFEISVNDITKLETEKELKQQMTANIAHELKTPVTAVSGFIETILDNPNIPKEKLFDFLEKSFDQISRLTLLLQDLSVLSKIEEASKMYDKNKLYLEKIVKDILLDYELKLQKNNIEIKVDIPVNYYLFGNKFLIDAIFRNLLDNSLKYAGNFNKIAIACQMKDKDFFYLYYKDNGIGIPDKHLSRIFERFYRIDKGRSRKLGGTGLGLSIVKNAILFHGGEIVAKNSIDNGLEYHFTLKQNN